FSPGATNPPTGTVVLKDASNSNATVATGTLSSGAFTFNVAAGALPAGTHNLFVSYGGDTYHLPQDSTAVPHTVNLVATTTSLVDNGPNPSIVGNAVSFTVTVSPTVPDGATVQLEDADNSNAVVGSGSLTSGTVNINVSNLSVGSTATTHHIFAVYAGDATYAASQSSQA